jgi:UrcA family protein
MRKMLIAAAAGLLPLSLVSGIAIAQTGSQVTVTATRIVETNIGRSPSGVPISNISLAYGVNCSALDLASHQGAMQCEKRVKDAAMAACKEISQKYPDATPNEADCAKAAADKAMVRVHEMEAAAANKPAK